jgi:queuine tRNA-ribosyltransferase
MIDGRCLTTMNESFFDFDVLFSRIRLGKIKTAHGVIDTPAFVPVATNAALKGIDSVISDELDIPLLFVNTYHMLVHPGVDIVEAAGGLHHFMQRPGPIITDSGGFQIFSLKYGGVTEELKSKGKKRPQSGVLKVSEQGVLFRSYRDGSMILLTPESTVQSQKKLGSDIIIPLDELLPLHIDPDYFQKSFAKTHRWQARSFLEHQKNKKGQLMYAVVHGGTDLSWRRKSCQLLCQYDFDGFAIGGSLGKNTQDVVDIVKATLSHLPPEKPKHLLGIADLKTIEAVLPLGIDTFDSAYPTKCARHGWLFSEKGPIKITQTKWQSVQESCSPCPRISRYSYSYLHHLFKSHESVGGMIASIHNLWYLTEWMKKIKTG